MRRSAPATPRRLPRRERRAGLTILKVDTWALRARAAAWIVIAASAALAWVNPTAAKYCWVLIPVVQWAAERRSARPAAPSGPSGTPGQ